MITSAAWEAWPGWEAYYVQFSDEAPAYLIHVDRKELARRLAAGEKFETIITGDTRNG